MTGLPIVMMRHPLVAAISHAYCHRGIVRLLVESGADVNTPLSRIPTLRSALGCPHDGNNPSRPF